MGRVAVLGTGIMGGPMARNLLRAGHDVTVWNRTTPTAEPLEAEGARVARPPGAARARGEPVFDGISGGQVWLGGAGLGRRLKLVVNRWFFCTIETLAETFVLAETLGADPRRFLEAISGGGMDMPYAHLKGEAI